MDINMTGMKQHVEPVQGAVAHNMDHCNNSTIALDGVIHQVWDEESFFYVKTWKQEWTFTFLYVQCTGARMNIDMIVHEKECRSSSRCFGS